MLEYTWLIPCVVHIGLEGQLWVVAHDLISLEIRDGFRLPGMWPIDVIHEVSNPSCNFGYLWLWSTSLYMSYAHHPAWLSGNNILWMEWVDQALGLPLFRIDILVEKFVIGPLSLLILLEWTWLCPTDSLCIQILLPAFYVPECPIYIRADALHVADVQFIYLKPFGSLHHFAVWLHQLCQWVVL